jgi:hypothetical protein
VSSYRNLEIIPPFQSRVALAENLQNQQNSAVSLAPRHIILIYVIKIFLFKNRGILIFRPIINKKGLAKIKSWLLILAFKNKHKNPI